MLLGGDNLLAPMGSSHSQFFLSAGRNTGQDPNRFTDLPPAPFARRRSKSAGRTISCRKTSCYFEQIGKAKGPPRSR